MTRLLSLVLHVVSSLSAAQSFGDGEGVTPSARPRLISGSIFAVVTSKATSGVVDGATVPTQLSTLRAASRHLKSGILIICVFRAHGFEPVRHAGQSMGISDLQPVVVVPRPVGAGDYRCVGRSGASCVVRIWLLIPGFVALHLTAAGDPPSG